MKSDILSNRSAGLIALVLLLGACRPSEDGSFVADTPSPSVSTAPTASGDLRLFGPLWVYWLQEPDLDRIAAADARFAVIDYSHDGTEEGEFSPIEVEAVKNGLGEGAMVLAYMSIGEAEDYRFYWKDSTRPWVELENPDWRGNFKVRYWDPGWQGVIFGKPDSYLDRIMAAGFDGVYLDIVDAYEYFKEQGREAAEVEMVDFVVSISRYAGERDPDFIVIPQNAPELGRHPRYLEAVEGIAQEGLYYGYGEEGESTPSEFTAELEKHLNVFLAAGKLVFVVDYATSAEMVRDAYTRSWARGYVSTVTVVELDRLPFELR